MRSWLTILGALVACGEDGQDEDLRCERGPTLAYASVAYFAASSPACTRDDECTLIDTTVSCQGITVRSCGTVVHRDLAGLWDARSACGEIEALPGDDTLSCEVSPSCAAIEPACVSGRCSGR